MSTLIFFRLCCRAPLTLMRSIAIAKTSHSNGRVFARQARAWNLVLSAWFFVFRAARMVRLREAPSEEQQSTKHKVQSSKVDAGSDFEPAGRLSRSCLAEERRGLYTGKSPQI